MLTSTLTSRILCSSSFRKAILAGEGEAALLKKGLYGTKQGSRRFYDHTDQVLTSIGFTQCPVEPCLYRYIDDHGEAFLLLYVDDAFNQWHNRNDQTDKNKTATTF